MQTVRITTAQNIDIAYELGGLGERIVARLIDLAIFILVGIFCAIMGASFNIQDIAGNVFLIVYTVLFVFYDLLCEILLNGQSAGKKVMKIRVISQDGAQPRISQYLLRWLFRIVDFGVGFGAIALVIAAISENDKRLGDIVAGTILIRTEPRTKINHIAFSPVVDDYQPVFSAAAQLSEQDIDLINEVINSYVKTGNNVLVYNMALRVKEHLNITIPPEMNDMRFLQTILKDYSRQIVQADTL
jgi:uncharacterized RDD family membrane protein YckC